MLSLVLPTYNEAANLPELFAALRKVLSIPHEVIVVDDDSPDQTWRIAEELKKQYPTIRVLRRIGRRGLSSAVTEGFAMATGDVLMVMDADLQHDPHLILALYHAVQEGADIAVASRYIEGGSVGEWVTGRRILSKTATWLAHALPPVHSTDPMSGFFAIRRIAYTKIAPKLHPTGFKILLEVLSCLPASSRLTEVPLQFQFRKHGESKLNFWVEWQFVVQLIRIALRRIIHLARSFELSAFLIVVFLMLLIFVPRAWRLRLLYLDSTVRASVQRTLQTVADREGWLLSGTLVEEVSRDHMRITHQDVHRGFSPVDCFDVSFADSSLTPCAK